MWSNNVMSCPLFQPLRQKTTSNIRFYDMFATNFAIYPTVNYVWAILPGSWTPSGTPKPKRRPCLSTLCFPLCRGTYTIIDDIAAIPYTNNTLDMLSGYIHKLECFDINICTISVRMLYRVLSIYIISVACNHLHSVDQK